ncbi:hypothetical protein [Curtobacterium sp. USHLN213]|uniref:hypothetical protein n=1 Tax=Curtobacterium sp. USHLN213 TaxID=3081255 RepID=UPI00301A046B
MALTRTEHIAHTGSGDVKALRAATEEIGDLLNAKLPEARSYFSGLVAGEDASSTEHIREAWKDFDEDGREPETGSISAAYGPRDGAFDVYVNIVVDVRSRHVSGTVAGFKRDEVRALASEIRAILKRHLS